MIDYRTQHAEALHDLDGVVSWIGPADLAVLGAVVDHDPTMITS